MIKYITINIDILSMEQEIRLTFLNENEIEYFINGTMQTKIRKYTSFNFKLYRIELSLILHGGNFGQPN